MSRDRLIYAILMGVSTALAAAASSDTLSGKVVAWLLVGAAGVNGILRVMQEPQSIPAPAQTTKGGSSVN